MDEQPHEFLRGRLARLPPLPSFPEDSTGDTDTSTETDSSTASVRTVVPVFFPLKSPPPINPSSPISTDPSCRTAPRYLFSVACFPITSYLTNSTSVSHAVPWNTYFAQTFRVPSPRNPSQSFNVYYTPPSADNAPVYVFHHGAGSSGLSFAICAGILKESIHCGIIAFDVRYHGATDIAEDKKEWELELDVLARDEVDVVQGVARYAQWEKENWPDLILVGHRYVIPKGITIPSPLASNGKSCFPIILLGSGFLSSCCSSVLYSVD
jgi:hypothetical protein